jgi:metallo-beta-lactamase family protein
MCNGGRIRHHLAQNISRRECHVIIAGFQATGTPGRALVEGAKHLRLFGEDIPVRAKIHTIGGLSAHAGQAELLAWYDGFQNRPPLILVHGEPQAQEALQNLIRRDTGGPVHIARQGEIFDLQKPIPFSSSY